MGLSGTTGKGQGGRVLRAPSEGNDQCQGHVPLHWDGYEMQVWAE